MNIIEDPEEQCPFDVSHWVAKSKMPYHIKRCIVNHPNSKKKQCSYVAYHYVDPEDFEQHCAECRLNILPNQWSDETKIDTLPVSPVTSQNPWGIDTEEVSSPLKDIQTKVDEDQPLIGHSKKQRKAHRHEIILRSQHRDNESESTSGDDASDVNSNGDSRNGCPRYPNSQLTTDAADPENLDMSSLTIQDSSKESKSWNAQGCEEPKQYNDFEAIQKEQMRSEKRQNKVRTAPPQNELLTVNLKTVQLEQKTLQRSQNQKPFSYADALKRK